MAEGTITLRDIIEEDALKWGDEYAKHLQKAIDKNNELTSSSQKLYEIYKKMGAVKTNTEFLEVQNKGLKETEKSMKIYNDRAKELAKVDEERSRSLKNLLTTEARLQQVNSSTNKQLIERRETLRQETLEIKRNLTFMGRLTQLRDNARKTVQELNAKKELGLSLSRKEQQELKKSSKEFEKYNKSIDGIRKGTKQFFENVGNYPKQLQIVGGAFKSLLPALGVLGALKETFNFAKEARQVALQARGVEFAFERLGKTGVDAFERVKKSTRGALSDLDIKTALVDFENFNISLEETDTLFEFLAVRSAQTGKSIDSLRDSLVEGLSKQSKLRIDNLGISAQALNEELERTPDFVQAVANIAKTEIKQAGSILDDAGNSQERFNAAFENFQLSVGKGFIAKASNALYDFGANALRAITPTRDLTNAVKQEQNELNNLVVQILETNEGEERRDELLSQLTETYPVMLKFLDNEKVSNENLKTALAEVNSLYIKRLALQRTIEKLDLAGKQNKLADETADLAKVNDDYQQSLTKINLYLNKNSLDTDLASKSFEQQNETMRRLITQEQARISQLQAQGKGTDALAKRYNNLEKSFNFLLDAQKTFTGASSQYQDAENAVADVNAEIEKLEQQLGITQTEMDDLFDFDGDEVVITVNVEEDKKAKEERIKQAQEDQFNLNKLLLQREIDHQKELTENVEREVGNRQLSNIDYFDAQVKLLDLEKERAKQGAQGRTAELKRIEEAYTDDYESLVKQREDRAEQILKESFERVKARLEEQKRLQEEALGGQTAEIDTQITTVAQDDTLSATERLEQIKKLEEQKNEIILKYNLDRLQIQKDAINDELESEYLTFEQREALQKSLTAIETAESDLRTEHELKNLEKKAEAEEKWNELKKEKIQEASEVIADSLNLDAQNVERLITGIVDGFDSVVEGIQASFAVAGDIVNSIFDNNIRRIDEQIEASEAYYDRQYELAQGDAEQQELIRQEQEAKRQALEDKKRKEQEKQAKWDKAMKVFNIAIATALGIMQAYAQLGPIGGTVAAVIIAALGAAQTAAVLAKPIPKYEKGTEFHPGGFALVGEKRAEVIKEPNRLPYVIDQPTVLPLARGSKVYKSTDEALAKITSDKHLHTFKTQAQSIKQHESNVIIIQNNDEDILKQMKILTHETIKNRMQPQKSQKDLNFELFRYKTLNWNG